MSATGELPIAGSMRMGPDIAAVVCAVHSGFTEAYTAPRRSRDPRIVRVLPFGVVRRRSRASDVGDPLRGMIVPSRGSHVALGDAAIIGSSMTPKQTRLLLAGDLEPGKQYVVRLAVNTEGATVIDITPVATPRERMHVGGKRYYCCACAGVYRLNSKGEFPFHKNGFLRRCDAVGVTPERAFRAWGPDDPFWSPER